MSPNAVSHAVRLERLNVMEAATATRHLARCTLLLVVVAVNPLRFRFNPAATNPSIAAIAIEK